jgi:hypothetical protein
MLACAAHEFDFTSRERRLAVAVGIAADQKSSYIRRKKLKKPLARFFINTLESGFRGRTARKIVFKNIMPGSEIMEKAPRSPYDKRQLPPFTDYRGYHRDRSDDLQENNSLADSVRNEKSVNKRICEK